METSDHNTVLGHLVLIKEEDTPIKEELEIKHEAVFFDEMKGLDYQGEKRSISPSSPDMVPICKRPWPNIEQDNENGQTPILCRISSIGSGQDTENGESPTFVQIVDDKQQLTTQAKQVIMNVKDFFRKRHQMLNETDLQIKVASAIGISVLSMETIMKQTNDTTLQSPTPDSIRLTPVMDCKVNSCKECIRKEILSFYERGEMPTLDSVLEVIKESPIEFQGARLKLDKLLRKIGFRYLMVAGGRRILMEKEYISASRCRFIRTINDNRTSSNPRTEVYIDETLVCHTEPHQRTIGSKLKTRKEVQYIIMHAGGEEGFMPGCLCVFKARINKGQYKLTITKEAFQTWFEKQLLPNIPNNSLIVMGNASCHSKFLNKVPSRCMKKCDIFQWLEKNNISYDKSFTKPELVHLVNCYKEEFMNEIDLVAHNHGHEVLRLPPHHNHLNPMELIWHQVKSEIKIKSSEADQTLQTAEQITSYAVARVTIEDWKMCLRRMRELGEDYKIKDKAVDSLVENLTINQEESTTDED